MNTLLAVSLSAEPYCLWLYSFLYVGFNKVTHQMKTDILTYY